jgi:AraC-like DNA-binding protein
MTPQALHLSTEAFALRDRIPAWREGFGRQFLQIEIEPDSPESFQSSAVLRAFPGIGIAEVTSSPARYVRSARMGDSGDVALVIAPPEGAQVVRDDVAFTLEAGDAVVMTANGNGTIAVPRGGRTVSLRVPRAGLASTVNDLGNLTCRRIPSATPSLRLLSRYLRVFADGQTVSDAAVRQQAAAHAVDLVTLALGATREAAEVAEARGGREARLRAIKDDVMKLLDRDDFSIGMIALRHRVTPRYIQTLFESDGTTFTEHVLAARLARAHRALISPRHAGQKISAIAQDAGFGDVSYFIRAFRRRYGVLPSDLRAQAKHEN